MKYLMLLSSSKIMHLCELVFESGHTQQLFVFVQNGWVVIICNLQQFRLFQVSDIFGTQLYHIKFACKQFKMNHVIIFLLLSQHGG